MKSSFGFASSFAKMKEQMNRSMDAAKEAAKSMAEKLEAGAEEPDERVARVEDAEFVRLPVDVVRRLQVFNKSDMDNIIAKHTEEMKLVCAENDFLRKKVATGLGESEEQLNQSIKDALGDPEKMAPEIKESRAVLNGALLLAAQREIGDLKAQRAGKDESEFVEQPLISDTSDHAADSRQASAEALAATLEAKIQEQSATIESLQEEVRSLLGKHGPLEEARTALEEQLADKEREMERMMGGQEVLQGRLQHLEKSLQMAQDASGERVAELEREHSAALEEERHKFVHIEEQLQARLKDEQDSLTMVKEKLTKFELSASEYASKCDALTEANEALRGELELQNKAAQAASSATKEAQTASQERAASLENDLKNVQEQLTHARKELNDAKEAKDAAESHLAEELERNSQNLAAQEEESTRLLSDLASLKSQLASLEDEKDRLEGEYEEAMATVEQLKEQTQNMKHVTAPPGLEGVEEKERKLVEVNKKLMSELKESRKECKQAIRQAKDANARIETAEAKTDELVANMTQAKDEYMGKLGQLQTELTKARKGKDAGEKESSSLREELARLTTEHGQLDANYSTMKQEYTRVQDELEQTKASLSMLHSKQEDADASLNSKLAEVQTQLTTSTEELSEKNEQIKELKSKATENEQEILELNKRLQESSSQLTSLGREKVGLEEQMRTTTRQLDEHQQAQLELERQLVELKAELTSADGNMESNLQERIQQVEDLQDKLSKAEQALAEQTAQARLSTHQAEEAIEENSSLKNKCEHLEATASENQHTIADLEAKVATLDRKLSDLEEQLADAQQHVSAEQEQRRQLEAALDSAQKQQEDENAQRQSFEGSVLAAEREKVSLEAELAKLRTQLTKVVNQANQKVEQKENMVKEAEQRLTQEQKSREKLQSQLEMDMKEMSAKLAAAEYEKEALASKREAEVMALREQVREAEAAAEQLQAGLQEQIDAALTEAKRAGAEASAATENVQSELEQERARLVTAEADRKEAAEELLAMAQMVKDLEGRLRVQEDEIRASEESLRSYRARANTLLKQKDNEIESILGGEATSWPQPVLKVIHQYEQSAAEAAELRKAAEEELESLRLELRRSEEHAESTGEDLKLMTMQLDAAQSSKNAIATRMRDLESEIAVLRAEPVASAGGGADPPTSSYEASASEPNKPTAEQEEIQRLKADLVASRFAANELRQQVEVMRKLGTSSPAVPHQTHAGTSNGASPPTAHSGIVYKSRVVDLDAASAAPADTELHVGPGHGDELMSTATILQLAKRQADQEHVLRNKDDEIRALREQLEESERTHELRNKSHDVLKSEIAMLTRQKRREEVDLAYLKNVIVKYMETEEHERLLPVLSMLLQITPDEVTRVEEARRRRHSGAISFNAALEGVTDLLKPTSNSVPPLVGGSGMPLTPLPSSGLTFNTLNTPLSTASSRQDQAYIDTGSRSVPVASRDGGRLGGNAFATSS